jgi:hypothetical protein
MGGMVPAVARMNEIQARIQLLAGDAVVPSAVAGVYTTMDAAAAGAAGSGGTAPATFAAAVAEAGAEADAA